MFRSTNSDSNTNSRTTVSENTETETNTSTETKNKDKNENKTKTKAETKTMSISVKQCDECGMFCTRDRESIGRDFYCKRCDPKDGEDIDFSPGPGFSQTQRCPDCGLFLTPETESSSNSESESESNIESNRDSGSDGDSTSYYCKQCNPKEETDERRFDSNQLVTNGTPCPDCGQFLTKINGGFECGRCGTVLENVFCTDDSCKTPLEYIGAGMSNLSRYRCRACGNVRSVYDR